MSPSVRLRPWSRWLEVRGRSERYQTRTGDGISLVLHRVRGEGPPVVLVHGLAADHRGLHFPGRSLAEWLAGRGFDCWLPDLRGSGESGRPAAWDLDDLLTRDLPAILELVREVTGESRMRWVGHSLGGVLLMAAGIRDPDLPVVRGVTVGSALDYRIGETGFARLLDLEAIIRRLPAVPYGAVTHLLAPLMARGVETPVERFNFWKTNVEPHIVRQLHASAFHTIPVSLLASLATSFEPRGLRDRTGRLRFVEQAARYRVPTLLVGGSRDPQCPVAAVEGTAALLTGADARVRIFGRAAGEADEYGHWDLLIGRRAADEVWPELADWLAAD